MRFARFFHITGVLLLFTLFGASQAHAAKYRIITEGEFGFKKGNTFFSLKMSAADFETKFGAPEKKTKVTAGSRLAYLNEGVCAVVEEGKIRSLTFVLVP